MVLSIVIYGGYITLFTPYKVQTCPGKPDRWPLIWCSDSVVMTLAIIALYAF